MSDFLPYDIDQLTGAAARVLLAPIGTTLPAKPADIYDQTAPYAPAGGTGAAWFNVGATSGPLQVGRNMALAGFNIEQSQTVLLEEPTEITYTVQVPIAELSPTMLQIINDSASPTGVAGTTGSGTGTKTPFGNVFDLTHYRIAFVVRKSKTQGEVIEGAGGKHRGRFVTYVGYDCSLTAENVQTNFGKGQLASATVTFKLYPDSGVTTEGEEHGFFFHEDAQTLTVAP